MTERVVLAEYGGGVGAALGIKRVLAMCICLSMLGVAETDTAAETGVSPEARFRADNDAAMKRMMKGMTIVPSGSIDRDFALMMIAHHQGAIDMARAELLAGSNEQLRRIAQEIVVEQQQEIAAMELVLKDSASGRQQPIRSDGNRVPLPVTESEPTSANRTQP